MSRTFLPGIVTPGFKSRISLKRALVLAAFGGLALLVAGTVLLWLAPALQAQSQDPADGLRFGPAPAAVTTAGLTLTAPNPVVHDWLGTSVSNAGDVNYDGYDDIIVGCHFCNVSGDNQEGKAFIFFGGPLMDTVVDVTLQAPSPATSGLFGVSVSTAGDVNGDGFDDVIVGCYLCDVSGNNNEGKAFIFFGGLNMDGTADKTLTAPSPASEDRFGRAVSAAGDVNGDGYDDVIVGCRDCDMGNTTNVGKAFIFFGPDMDTMDAKTLGPPLRSGGKDKDAYSAFGGSVATAGDVNGDGFADVIVGCPNCDLKNAKFQGGQGKAFIYFGGSNMDTTVDKILTAPVPVKDDYFGNSVATAGNVNGDDYDDVIVGCVGCDVDGLKNTGSAFVFFGGSAMDEVADRELHMAVPLANRSFGNAVSTAGDLNGDGFADVVVGCYLCAVPPFGTVGQAFVFLGGPDMDEIVDETLEAPTPAFKDYFGYSVSTAGDVNGDGLADLILGCRNCDIDISGCGNVQECSDDEGKAFLRFGEADGSTATMYVADITLSATRKGKNTQVTAQVKILDENDNPVPNATVTGDLRRNGSVLKSGASGTTGALGVATIESGRIKDTSSGDEFEFCVTDVAHSGLDYLPDDDIPDPPCGQTTVP